MHHVLRAFTIACALSLALGNSALALNPQPEPPGIAAKLSDGRQVILNKQHVLKIQDDSRSPGKPLAPGIYKLSNGHSIKVGPGGVVDPKSLPEFNRLGNKGYT
jgi:hypothetical protein